MRKQRAGGASIFVVAVAVGAAVSPAVAAEAVAVAPVERLAETGFRSIFDGQTLAGWHVSAATSHSGASGHRTGGFWGVQDGAILGSQDTPGNGGILITDEAFRDFEVALETRNDFGVDSGIFLRSTESGAAYQVMIDYYPGGTIGGIYGEGLPGNLYVKNFEFLDAPERIRLVPSAFPSPLMPEAWTNVWKINDWNELRARIVGNPPTITAWINGVRFMEFHDAERRLADSGGIALQVHGGGDHTRQFVRYRNIRVKRLD